MKLTTKKLKQLIKEELNLVISETYGTDEEYKREGLEAFDYKGHKFAIKHDFPTLSTEIFYLDPDSGMPNYIDRIVSKKLPLPDKEDFYTMLDKIIQRGL